MNTNDKPTVISQTIIKQPVEKVFQAMYNPKLISTLWFAESFKPMKEGEISEWKWKASNFSLKIWTKKIIPNKLIATVWQDPNTAIDYKFNLISDHNTLITLKAYNFKETGIDLLYAMKDKRSMFNIALKNLGEHFTPQKDAQKWFYTELTQVIKKTATQ